MYFSIHFNTISIMLLCAAAVFALLCVLLSLRRLSRVSRAVRADTALAGIEGGEGIDKNGDTDPCAGLPRASVIVYSYDEAANLRTLLPQLLEQDYAPGFEVIVVNEGESAQTTEVVDLLRLSHDNLYLTFTPDGVRNLSRKKLGLTLGVKAAQNPVVVNVTGSTLIDSPQWLRRIMRHYAGPTVEVVLGYALPVDGDTGWGKRRRAFERTASATAWLSAALGGHPYRGTGYNLSYRRDTFFANKGFSHSLNLHHGDDDIFVSEIATGDNTAVELSQQSFARINCHNHRREHSDAMNSHHFTGHFVSKASRRTMAAGTWSLWLSAACAIAAAIAGLPDLTPSCIAAVLLIAIFICVTLVWRRTMRALCQRPLFFTLPWLIMTQPLRNVARDIRCRRDRRSNYTWTHK